jgi:phospholipase/carboxylesterase
VETAAVRGKPFAIVHGTQDRTIPVKNARAARDYLAGLGAVVQYHEFPIGHNVGQASLAVLDTWLQSQLGQEPS